MVLKYVVPVFLPFIIAISVAFSSRPLKLFIMKKTKMTSKASAVAAVTLILGILIYIFFHLFGTMANELASVYDYLTAETDISGVLFGTLSDVTARISDFLPFLNLSELSPADRLSALLTRILPGFTTALGEAIAATAKAVPYALVFVAVTVISTFYFSVDLEKITAYLSELFPKNTKKLVSAAKSKVASAVFKYVRAYLFILLMTFTELYIGFLFLRLPYAFSLAIIVAIVDVLPVLGTGTVLIPWSFVAFAMGNTFMGAGVLTLYVLVALIRQFSEPKIVGKSIGLYPPLTLVGMYVGIKLFGVWGIFVLPLLILCAKSVLEIFAVGAGGFGGDTVK